MNFKLSAMVTISIYTEVEADTIEEAVAEAEGRSIESYHWGADYAKKEFWIADDYDGEPTDIKENE